MNPEKISQTAAFIAIKLYGMTLSQPFRSWFDPATLRFYEQIVQALPAPLSSYRSVLKNKWIRSFFAFSEELLLPGDLFHILTRKYCIDKAVERALAGPYKQLLVLGAGFDHLGAKYSKIGVRSVEMDTRRMAGFKRHFLDEHGYLNNLLAVNSLHIGLNSLSEVLHEKDGADSDLDTVVVAEGFFDYISADEMDDVLGELHSFFKGRVLIISTLFALDELPRFRRWVFKTGVKVVGEKIRLGLSKKQVEKLFRKNGLSISSIADFPALVQSLPQDTGRLKILEGFYIIESENSQKK